MKFCPDCGRPIFGITDSECPDCEFNIPAFYATFYDGAECKKKESKEYSEFYVTHCPSCGCTRAVSFCPDCGYDIKNSRPKQGRYSGDAYVCDDVLVAVDPRAAEFTFPDGITQIGDGAFYNCNKLKEINIPDGVTEIGKFAFYDCSALRTVAIPDSVIYIGSAAFCNCDAFKYTRYDNLFYLGNTDNPYHALITYDHDKIHKMTSCTVHPNTKVIAGMAFYVCTTLAEITLPDGLKGIGDSAFVKNRIVEMTIPASVEKIGEDALSDGKLIVYCKAKNIARAHPEWHGSRSVVYDCDNNNKSDDGSEIVKRGGVRYAVKDGAAKVIAADMHIKSAIIPEYIEIDGCKNKVTEICTHAFFGCDELTSVIIPATVKIIGHYAFFHCAKLGSVALPDSARTIADRDFGDCYALRKIVLPKNVRIEKNAFCGSGKQHVYYAGTQAEYQAEPATNHEGIQNAVLYFYSETAPSTDGRFWHYGANERSVAEWNQPKVG